MSASWSVLTLEDGSYKGKTVGDEEASSTPTVNEGLSRKKLLKRPRMADMARREGEEGGRSGVEGRAGD
jgi:hypothetical protein